MAAILQPSPSIDRTALRVLPGGLADASVRPVVVAVDWRSVAVAVVSVVLAAALAVAVGRGAFASMAPPSNPSVAVATGSGTEVIVEPGDTMWSIARRIQPAGDVRPLVDRLVAAHGTVVLQPGDVVAVP